MAYSGVYYLARRLWKIEEQIISSINHADDGRYEVNEAECMLLEAEGYNNFDLFKNTKKSQPRWTHPLGLQ